MTEQHLDPIDFPVEPPIEGLPDWIPPSQGDNPGAGDVNGVSTTVSERILTVSPWGTYVPIVFGTDIIGGILTLVEITGGFLYMRLVWCVGEIESIEEVTLEDGSIPDGTVFTHYTGTSTQTADATLAGVVTGYTDTLKDIGPDDIALAYSVVKVPTDSLEEFPVFIAKIKGLKMKSPVPKTKSTRLTTASETDSDTLTYVGNVITITDNTDGTIGQFIRYEEDELIDGENYNIEVEVTAISDMGSGNALVQWCGASLIDTNTSLQMNINALGTYNGTANFTGYDATNNFIRFDITGANTGVSLTYKVTIYNALGNAVAAYSDIAAVALNHLITDTSIGLGLTSDLDSYVDLINRNSQVLASGSFSESRSAIGLTLNKKSKLGQVIEVMRGYARCTLSNRGGEYTYYPLQAQTASFSITKVKPGTLKPEITDMRNIPNIVRVYYTDTYTDPWKDNFVQIETSEVTAGTEYKREAVFRMPGFQSRTAALRFAYDRINERLRSFKCKFRTHEDFYDAREGQTFNLTHDVLSASSQKMKLLSMKKVGQSEWEIEAVKESDSIYSDEIADYDPDAGTIELADPSSVTDATGLGQTIETPKYQTSVYFSRARVTWTKTTYQYNHFYRCALYEDSSDDLIDMQEISKTQAECMFNNIQEDVTYRIELHVIGFGGTSSTGVTSTFTPDGKNFPPTDVPYFEVFDIGGNTTLTWTAAADNDELTSYQVQYGASGFLWDSNESRILHARIDATNYITSMIPPGEYDFLIKARDNAGNYSTNATRVSDVTIHPSPDMVEIATDTVTVDTQVRMVPFLSDRVTAITNFDPSKINVALDYVTKTGDNFGSMFPNAMSTYTDDLLTYGPGEADFQSVTTEQVDAGSVVDAIWTVETNAAASTHADYSLLAGEIVEAFDETNQPDKYIEVSETGSSWTRHEGLSVRANARYARFVVGVPSAQDTRFVFRANPMTINVRAYVKKEYFSDTTSSGTVTFDLANETTNIQSMTVSVNSSGSNYAIIEKVGSSPWSQVKVTVYDETGAIETAAKDVTAEVRYL